MMSRDFKFWIIMGAFWLVVVEAAAFGFLHVFANFQPFFFYTPPSSDLSQSATKYLEYRDSVLGWPAPRTFGAESLDESGARFLPTYPEVGNACISIYGDSFAYGSEVSHEDAWANQLAKLVECRVANFGVGGYGTDQALVRFTGNQEDEAETVLLTILPHNLMRNVNQYRHFLTGRGSFLGFKPRFLLNDQDELELVTIPTVPPREMMEFFDAPDQYLEHDFFAPGGSYAPVLRGFPYTLATLELILGPRLQSVARNFAIGLPLWADFMRPEHASSSYKITVAIITEFAEIARLRGKKLVVILIPTPSLLDFYDSEAKWLQHDFREELRGRGIKVLDMSPIIHEAANSNGFCALLTSPEDCKGHFNPAGNALFAQIVADALPALTE